MNEYTDVYHAGIPFGVYLILTDPVAGYEPTTSAAVRCRVRHLQLRMKNDPPARVLEMARRLRKITHGTLTRLIINDDLDAAIEADADGIHLGQDDLPLDEARARWQRPDKLFGLSTHNEEQARRARDLHPDYIGVGPVYPTPTKARPDPVLGCERAGHILRNTPLPTVAIGGIDQHNLHDVMAQGARSFAVVRAVNQAPDPERAIRELQAAFERTLVALKTSRIKQPPVA